MDSQNKLFNSGRRLSPYIAYLFLGFIAFYTYTQVEFNFIAKNYLILFGLQSGMLGIYFFTKKIRKHK